MESVSKQLMHPSILDGSFRDNAQALVNRWNQAKNNANERMLKLDEKFENAKKLLDDVNMAIDWLSKCRIFDKIRSGKQKFQQEQDKDKKIDILQVRTNYSDVGDLKLVTRFLDVGHGISMLMTSF